MIGVFLTLGVFGASDNDAHLRWVDAESRRCSVGYRCVEDAWTWRRTRGDRDLLSCALAQGETWVDYAAISRAHVDDVEPRSHKRHVLREHVDADQVVAAIREYTRKRCADGDSVHGRAKRLLGDVVARQYTGERVRGNFTALEHRAANYARSFGGRRWMSMPADPRYVELLECSRGANFSRRYLRSVRVAP